MEFNKTDITRLLDGIGYALGNNFESENIVIDNIFFSPLKEKSYIQAEGYTDGKDGYRRRVNIELQKEKVDLHEQADE